MLILGLIFAKTTKISPHPVNNTRYTFCVCVYMCLFVCVCVGAVDCGNLTNPANGHVNQTTGTTFGQTAIYSCNTGYNLVGESTHTCQATGEWSGSEPTCERALLMKLFEVTEQGSTSELNVDSLCSVIRESVDSLSRNVTDMCDM